MKWGGEAELVQRAGGFVQRDGKVLAEWRRQRTFAAFSTRDDYRTRKKTHIAIRLTGQIVSLCRAGT